MPQYIVSLTCETGINKIYLLLNMKCAVNTEYIEKSSILAKHLLVISYSLYYCPVEFFFFASVTKIDLIEFAKSV